MEEAHPYYPPTVNNAELAAFVKDVGARYIVACSPKVQECVHAALPLMQLSCLLHGQSLLDAA